VGQNKLIKISPVPLKPLKNFKLKIKKFWLYHNYLHNRLIKRNINVENKKLRRICLHQEIVAQNFSCSKAQKKLQQLCCWGGMYKSGLFGDGAGLQMLKLGQVTGCPPWPWLLHTAPGRQFNISTSPGLQITRIPNSWKTNMLTLGIAILTFFLSQIWSHNIKRQNGSDAKSRTDRQKC
jgi:hypothetical protein